MLFIRKGNAKNQVSGKRKKVWQKGKNKKKTNQKEDEDEEEEGKTVKQVYLVFGKRG